jgi:hypothetical protein
MSKKNELSIDGNLRDLLIYIRRLGEHTNQIYNRLDHIDASIRKVKKALETSIANNATEIIDIKKTTITKSEFNALITKLNEPFQQFSPAPSSEHPRKMRVR